MSTAALQVAHFTSFLGADLETWYVLNPQCRDMSNNCFTHTVLTVNVHLNREQEHYKETVDM